MADLPLDHLTRDFYPRIERDGSLYQGQYTTLPIGVTLPLYLNLDPPSLPLLPCSDILLSLCCLLTWCLGALGSFGLRRCEVAGSV